MAEVAVFVLSGERKRWAQNL